MDETLIPISEAEVSHPYDFMTRDGPRGHLDRDHENKEAQPRKSSIADGKRREIYSPP